MAHRWIFAVLAKYPWRKPRDEIGRLTRAWVNDVLSYPTDEKGQVIKEGRYVILLKKVKNEWKIFRLMSNDRRQPR